MYSSAPPAPADFLSPFVAALTFLTILPVPGAGPPSPTAVARSRFWYPAVGLLLGGLLAGWTAALGRMVSPLLASFLVLLAWVGLTGALHVDGFCDLCDGLFGGASPEDRLRILKDPHLGTFGLVGGVLLLTGKLVLLNEVIARLPLQAPWLVGGAVLVGRSVVLVMAAGARYPRSEGTGKLFIESVRWTEAAVLVPVLAAGTLLLAIPPLLVVLGGRWVCNRRLGGVTGDCLGAAIELAEVVFLLGAALLLPRFAA
jgi:adenosylcobinamide-GDP ribazoletransferase